MIKNRATLILLALLTFWFGAALAEETLPLPGDKAFVFSAFLENPQQLVLEWHIAPGYYLYRDKLQIKPSKNLGAMQWPASTDQNDPVRGTFRAYENVLRLTLPLTKQAHQPLNIAVQYQGCSHDGFCYAPMKKQLHLTYPFSGEGIHNAPLLMVSEASAPEVENAPSNFLQDQYASQAFLGGHTFLISLLCFLGLGLLLAFTPCTLPMIPILSSIIAGQEKLSGAKAFKLSLAYVLGMALTYAGAGLAIAWAGRGIQAYFQNPWIICAFSLLFVLLAFSMLGVFQFPLPKAWLQKVTQWQQRQKGGNYPGVFLMGCLSTLVVSPCVTAPLVGVLAYISESGNLVLGGSALFALGLGMGLPLLLLGYSAGKYLPKTGPWMELVKKLFGFLLLGMAIWMLSRILPEGMIMFFWGCLLVSLAVFLFFVDDLSGRWRALAYFSGGLFGLYSFILFIGVAMSYNSPFYPFEKMVQSKVPMVAETIENQDSGFTRVKSMAHLNTLLKQAKREKKPVILDFYAEWCESCQVLEKAVLRRVEVQNQLRHFVLLRANVTENNDFDQALMKRYDVIAPPTFLFINREGQEVSEKRIVGEVDHQLFLAHASAI